MQRNDSGQDTTLKAVAECRGVIKRSQVPFLDELEPGHALAPVHGCLHCLT